MRMKSEVKRKEEREEEERKAKIGEKKCELRRREQIEDNKR